MLNPYAEMKSNFAEADHARFDAVCEAVTLRAMLLTCRFIERSGAFLYTGSRTKPENLGWRFIQMHGLVPVSRIEDGSADEEVTETWHEAASAEYFYTYEKDYGSFAEFDCD